MLTNESQVRLTINLEGRLAAKAANSNSKKEKKLATILEKKGKKFFGCSNYPNCDFVSWNEPIKEPCSKYQRILEINKFLFTLGCFEGETISIVKKMYSNLIINIKGGRYGIDKDLAEVIEIF